MNDTPSEPSLSDPAALLLKQGAGEELRITKKARTAPARLSAAEAVQVGTDRLVADGEDMSIYRSVSATFYEASLPGYVDVPAGTKPAWLLWFWLYLAPGVDMFPDYAEIVVWDTGVTKEQ